MAADPASRGKGVLVVLNDEINSAREVTKTDALRLHTFQSRGYGVLGVVDSDRVVYYRDVVKRHTARSEFDVIALEELPRVDVVMVYQGATGDIIKALVDQGAKGIVIAVGRRRRHERHTRRGHPVRDRERGVRRDHAPGPASGRIAATAWPGRRRRRPLPDCQGEDLAPVKARILLMLALTTTNDGAEIQRMFTECFDFAIRDSRFAVDGSRLAADGQDTLELVSQPSKPGERACE